VHTFVVQLCQPVGERSLSELLEDCPEQRYP
jgi:hypothetical protein